MSMPKTVDVIFGSQYTPIYERTDRQLKTNLVNAGFPDDAESLRYCPVCVRLSSVMGADLHNRLAKV